ncbi:acyl-CoA thioesterase [Natrarchaeobius chitinivorans]|uniref:Acyl-CoA thioesterase n=1 Tax=Natrarchaeobius chitinivorans TaxID=1679083 RepID=A0A3N6PC49_NATCH|nr:thioesterase family protein [Natrarchaeobius chitinivorans]RQG94265.1 acyl-CoA thioesterase [Natrarchaeobius chitinivorans]
MTDGDHPAVEDPVFERQWTVRFSDSDPFEIAHYPRIIDALHQTADEYVESIGWPFWTMTDEHGIGLPIVDVGARFHQPVRAGDVVTIGMTATVGDSSVRFEYAGTVDGELAFTGYEQRVCVEVGGESSIPVPDGLREALMAD